MHDRQDAERCPRSLVAIPVYNEARYVRSVLERVLAIHPDVLVIDDGSTDQTPEVLSEFPVTVVRNDPNRGYGFSMREAFAYAAANGYEWLITMDCDDQHEPAAIPRFLDAACEWDDVDIVSGSRYLNATTAHAPADRRAINRVLTGEINALFSREFGGMLTDAFCGFKAYRVESLRKLTLTENGYAFPMQFWVQAAAHGLRVRELPVKLIYNDPTRTFGPVLNDPEKRLRHYRDVLQREFDRVRTLIPAHRSGCTGCDCPDTLSVDA
jgi:dolichol-phosphate mannosyltransferase